WDPRDVIHHCGSGVSGCHNLLAMMHAGLDGSLLYPGSWSEWCADPSRPVAKGREPGRI
ncbi:MAG: sulfurtransferase, partial [Thiomonas sp. 20-64-5]